MARLGRRRITAVAAAAAVLLAVGVLVVLRDDDRRSQPRATASDSTSAPMTTTPAPATLAPSTTADAVTLPSSIVQPAAPTTTRRAPATTPTAPATSRTSQPPRPAPAPTTLSADMNGISLRLRIEPAAAVVGGQLYVGFTVTVTSSLPRCCNAALQFSDQRPVYAYPALSKACSTGTKLTTESAGRRFTSSGEYRFTLTARTCPPVPTTGAGVTQTISSAELRGCIRLDLSPTAPAPFRTCT